MGHYSGLQGAVERSKQQIFCLSAQLPGSLELLRGRLEQRQLVLFFFAL
jgi:hypothetical protein